MNNNLIFDDEDIIGFSWDVAKYIKDVIENDCGDDDDREIFQDFLKDVEEHDGLVKCVYHPMGAYLVFDLVVA